MIFDLQERKKIREKLQSEKISTCAARAMWDSLQANGQHAHLPKNECACEKSHEMKTIEAVAFIEDLFMQKRLKASS